MHVIADLRQQSLLLQILHNLLPRREPVQSRISSRRRAHLAVVGHHVDFRQAVPPAGFEIVWIVRWRNLHRARPEFPVHHLVRNDRNLPIHQRQNYFLPHECLYRSSSGCTATAVSPSIVSGRVVATVMYSLRSRHRVPDVPQMPLRSSCSTSRSLSTVKQSGHQFVNVMSAVNQPFFVQPHKHFAHHARKLRRQRESLPGPVAAFPNLLHLLA